MVYRYNYGALMGTDPSKANNFKPLSEVAGTQDFGNQAVGLLQQKGITSAAAANQFIGDAVNNAGGSTVQAMQNIAGLTEQQTAVARGDTWGGSDDTMGRSWLEAVVAGDAQVSGGSILSQVNQLYKQGFGREADVEGLTYWGGQGQYGGQSIQDIAKHFLASEESKIRDVYHEEYGRDADQAGLDYWMDHTGQADYGGAGTAHHGAYDASQLFRDTVTKNTKTAETNVRRLLSEQLGIHSSDAQRQADASLDTDGDGKWDVFTDASEEDVYRMINSGDFGAAELAELVRMQKAAQHMGDYGGGPEDAGATNIHRILSKLELSNPEIQKLTADDYLPKITKTLDAEGNLVSREESNVWSLLKPKTQDYGKEDVITTTGETTPIITDVGEGAITATNQDVDYTPELHSDVADTSSYGRSKEAFDSDAAGIDAPLQDMMIRNTGQMDVGGSAEGVRLKRSKKFKSGESALGTKQLGRELQIKSLNI